MLYLTEEEVRRLLPMPECIALLREMFQRLASGEAINQPRRRLMLPTHSTLHYMAAADGGYFGTKVYATNPRRGAYFLFLLYAAADAAPLAILEANFLGQIRTGAASGLATSLLARSDAHTVGIVGSGFQAFTQLEAMTSVRRLTSATVWSRSAEKRQAFAAKCAHFGIPVIAAASAGEAVRDKDIVITATNSKDPVLEDAWIAPGTHLNVMGSNQATRRELPSALLRRADLVVVDNREQSEMEAGDLLLAARDEGLIPTVELGEIVAGREGRKRSSDITLFKSLGIAAEDVAAAAFVYRRAVETGAGRPVYS